MADKKTTPAKGSDGDKILYIVTYLLGWLTGILIYITEGQKNKRLKFHAVQAILLGIVATIIGWIPFVGWIVLALIWLYGLYIGWQGMEGKDILVPVLGEWAKKYSS